MRKLPALLMFALVLGLPVLAGCGTYNDKGYFYLRPQRDGYVVVTDSDPEDAVFLESHVVSEALPLADAMQLCNQLNKDLGSHARVERKPQ
jgi:hypothetical protein